MGLFKKLFGAKPKTSLTPTTHEEEQPQTAAETAATAAVETGDETAAETDTAAVAEVADETAAEIATETAAPATDEAPWDARLQKRLDTYFARLRQEFPDGEIVRLNTGHKKLAERGAELRRLCGYEGDLDGFFALGGFTYRRSAGGRPTLPTAQTASVGERLRMTFPEDVPTLTAVQQQDHRLYLDLRAAARQEGCTVGAYLNRFKEQ